MRRMYARNAAYAAKFVAEKCLVAVGLCCWGGGSAIAAERLVNVVRTTDNEYCKERSGGVLKPVFLCRTHEFSFVDQPL